MALNKKNSIAFLFTFCLLFAQAQIAPPVKYWIKFKNKTGTPYTLSNPSAFLTQKSIDRRTKYNTPYHESDLPVNPDYQSSIEAVDHVKVFYVSKWLNGAVVVIDSASVAQVALNTISSYAFVQSSGKVRKYKLNMPPDTDPTNFAQNKNATIDEISTYNYGGAVGQNRQLRIDSFHNKGFRGQGITIAVMDVGFNNVDSGSIFDSLRTNGGILGTRDFVEGGTNAYRGGGHGTNVLSCMAANKPGVAIGTAPLAKYWLFRTEEAGPETISEEYNWIRAAEFADSVGVDMITTSLGYTDFNDPSQNHTYSTLNGRTAPMSIAANMAARKGIFVLNAAGNEGNSAWKFISVPADADSICTVGAVDTAGVYTSFSSVGPTADGRIKPDLVARGEGSWICDGNNCYWGNGTSFATPIIAGAIACYWQSNRSMNNIRLLDTLRKIGSNAQAPNNKIGWGIPNMKTPATQILPILPDADFDFTVYANPGNSLISLKLERLSYNFITIEIFDPVGKLLLSSTKEIPDPNSTIELNAQAASDGIYLVKVKTSKGTKVKKFLKQ